MSRRTGISILAALAIVASFAATGSAKQRSTPLRVRTTSAAPAGAVAPTGASATNLLCDGGFEVPGGCWENPTIVASGAITTNNPNSGSYSFEACTGSPDATCTQGLQQTIQVPSTVTTATMDFWAAGTTTDSNQDCSSFAGFGLIDPEEPMNQYLQGICEVDLDGSYRQVTDATPELLAFVQQYEGEQLLAIAVGQAADQTLGSVSGSFFVDDAFLSIAGANVTVYKRNVSLALRRHLKAKGAVTLVDGGPGGCIKGVKVNIQRKVAGKWKGVDTATTDSDGKYKKGIPDKTGTYRAVAPRVALTETKACGKATSGTKTHQH